MTPLWLLDVDGVINAVSRPVPIGYQSVMVPCGRHEFPITYRPEVVAFIRQMHTSGQVEVRWLTTWCEYARDNLAPALDLPEFKVEGSDDHRYSSPKFWWKSITAERLVAQDPERPIIWTDDDLRYSIGLGDCDWLKTSETPGLLVTPDTQTGLSDAELAKITQFVDSCAELASVRSTPGSDGSHT